MLIEQQAKRTKQDHSHRLCRETLEIAVKQMPDGCALSLCVFAQDAKDDPNIAAMKEKKAAEKAAKQEEKAAKKSVRDPFPLRLL